MLSYCGLVDAKIRASDKDLPVRNYGILRILSIFLEWKEKTFAFSQVKFLTLKLGLLTQAMRLLMLTQVLI